MARQSIHAFSSARCPISAEIVRAYREAFGDDVKVIKVHEAGFHHPPVVAQMPKQLLFNSKEK